jgi:GTP-binding protein Era
MIEAFNSQAEFSSIVPISVKQQDGVDRVLREVSLLLPEAEAQYEADTLTDRPTRFFLAEFIREQVLNLTGREVPHAVAVAIEQVDESTDNLKASATIHVQKQGQRAIVVGRGGTMIREIGMRARQRLALLIGKEVHLNLFVRVTPRWKDVPRQLSELGYDGPTSRDVAGLEHSVQKALSEKKST